MDRADEFGKRWVPVALDDLEAAREALGDDGIAVERVKDALDSGLLTSKKEAQKAKRELETAEAAFAAAGGRGVETAEEIDDLRICLAVYEATKKK